MARSAYSALTLAVLLAVVDFGSCLRCFQCNSQSSPDCKDPFVPSTKYLVDCLSSDSTSYNRNYLTSLLPGNLLGSGVDGAPKSCVKIVLETGTTVRTCLDANPNEPNKNCEIVKNMANVVGVGSKVKHCSSCDKDSCNGAGSITASLPIALVAVVVSYLYYK